ncbi:Uncharacterised protein [Nocardia farcinica]|nr:Uncharacterised protein [Nocardia farcinica]
MVADSPTRRTVTTVPSVSVREISPPGSGTKVSAFAAPVEHSPSAMVAAAPGTGQAHRSLAIDHGCFSLRVECC